MIIPYDQLAEETLINLIEEFIGREGTDYGEHELSLTKKTQQVHQQLAAGKAVILYDTESCEFTIVFKDQLNSGLIDGV